MNSPALGGSHRISDNLSPQNLFVDITHICSKSPALKSLCWEQNVFPLSKIIVTKFISNSDLAITLVMQLTLQFDSVPTLT